MNKPKFRKISEANLITIKEVENIIEEVLECEHIHSYPIEDLTLEKLDILAEYAKINNIAVTITAEHSNFHQGTLIQVLRKEFLDGFIKYI